MLVLGLVLGLALSQYFTSCHYRWLCGSVCSLLFAAVSAGILGHDLCFELAADRMRLQPLNQHSDDHSTCSFAGLLCDRWHV